MIINFGVWVSLNQTCFVEFPCHEKWNKSDDSGTLLKIKEWVHWKHTKLRPALEFTGTCWNLRNAPFLTLYDKHSLKESIRGVCQEGTSTSAQHPSAPDPCVSAANSDPEGSRASHSSRRASGMCLNTRRHAPNPPTGWASVPQAPADQKLHTKINDWSKTLICVMFEHQ